MSVRELRQIVKQAEGKGIPDYARLMRLEGTEVDPPDVEKRILDLAREAEGLVEETRKNLQNFELSVKNASKEYSKKKTLAELEKLQRRLRRFHKDIGKLSGYLRPEKGPSD
jgi:predicted phage gp36 major capsid-like protein